MAKGKARMKGAWFMVVSIARWRASDGAVTTTVRLAQGNNVKTGKPTPALQTRDRLRSGNVTSRRRVYPRASRAGAARFLPLRQPERLLGRKMATIAAEAPTPSMTSTATPSSDDPDAPRALLQATDWSRTPLGPLTSWPRALHGYAQMVLDMPTPAILFWGPEQTQIYNAGYAVILGPRHPRAFGMPYREAWPDTYPLIYPWMRHVLDNGGTWRVDRAHIPVTRHGFDEEAYFTFTFSPLRDDAGRIMGILQPVFDVSESVLADRRAETLRLLLAEHVAGVPAIGESLAAMVGNANDLPFAQVWLWDAKGMELVASGHVGESLVPDDAGRLAAIAHTVWAETAPRFVEVSPDADAGLARSALLLPLDGPAGGPPAGVIAIGVSRRLHFDDRYRRFIEQVARQLAASLQRAEASRSSERQRQYLDELFMQAPAGIAVLDGPEHVIELANPAYHAFIGRRDIVGKRLLDALPELRDQPFPALLDEVYRTGIAHVGNEAPAQLRRGPDGRVEEACFNYVYQPLRDGRGLTSGILVFAYEVTEQVNARRHVERLADELRAEHRRKDDFLAMLAHELRNPLAPISAAAEVLRLGQAGDARLRRTSEIVTRQVRHMATLIDDLLDASRVTRGLVTIEQGCEDLRDMIAAAVEQAAPLIELRRHRLAVSVGSEFVCVLGDRKRLVQALANLLDNAAKYTAEGGAIELALEHDGRDATIHVRDDGVGVPPDMRERIFGLFVQGQRSADRAQGGLGIGLALARRLVELHGGTLECVDTASGSGSDFRIRLPLAPASAPCRARARAAPDAAVDHGPKPTILIVDDNEDAARMLAMLLEDAGHEVMTESDPMVALERAARTRPDVFLLDIGLPRMDGHELARRLRATDAGRGATLIALTGYGQAAEREKAAQAGFDHYLVKPPDPVALRRLLGSLAPASN
jgi:signal transduction histidine kinase